MMQIEHFENATVACVCISFASLAFPAMLLQLHRLHPTPHGMKSHATFLRRNFSNSLREQERRIQNIGGQLRIFRCHQVEKEICLRTRSFFFPVISKMSVNKSITVRV